MLLVAIPFAMFAQSDIEPPVPKALLTNGNGEQEELSEGDSYQGEAPLTVEFSANASEYDDFSRVCTWTFMHDDNPEPILVRYDANVTYEFLQAGLFSVGLKVVYTHKSNPNLILEYEYEPFSISISESSLKVPNAFSPNGDGINDYFRITAQSIVKLRATFVNRWGQKVHSATLENTEHAKDEPNKLILWDGRKNGEYVKDGVYFLNLYGLGSDGLEYKIKKAVNVLKGFREGSEAGGGS